MSHDPTSDFAILYVCWANQCRSAVAVLMLTAAVGQARRSDNTGWVVGSPEDVARTGAPLYPVTTRLLAERGLDVLVAGKR